MAEKKKPKTNHPEKRPLLEWIIAGAGCLLVLTAIGAMIHRAMSEKAGPPLLQIKVDSITPAPQGYLVKFVIENSADQTAAAVTILGELVQNGEIIESSTMTLSYAPANSQREGGLYFTKNPAEHQLAIRATGYQKP